MSSLIQLKKELKNLAKPKQAKILQRFFKTGPGEYGEGDVFLGIKMPIQRKVEEKYLNLSVSDLQKLLKDQIHEYRMVGLLILVGKYKQAGLKEKKELFNFYLKNTRNINNWDLVDVTCPNIVGDYLLDKPRYILYRLVKSKSLWDRRIAIISTFAFIRSNDLKDAFKLSAILLNDKHDLMHKAVGWMLREAGKKDQTALERFLNRHAKIMPRTMLRYAIERLSEPKRKFYMKK